MKDPNQYRIEVKEIKTGIELVFHEPNAEHGFYYETYPQPLPNPDSFGEMESWIKELRRNHQPTSHYHLP